MKNLKYTLRLIFAFLLILLAKSIKGLAIIFLGITLYFYLDEILSQLIIILDFSLGYLSTILFFMTGMCLSTLFLKFDELRYLVKDEEYVQRENKVNSKKSNNSKILKSQINSLALKRILNEMIAENILSTGSEWEITSFQFQLLNSNDVKLLLSFFKALKKVGRNILLEKAFEHDPRLTFYKMLNSNVLVRDEKKFNEEIRNNEHLTALAQLYTTLASGNQTAIWKESREIVEHYHSHICQKINGKYQNWAYEVLPNMSSMEIELMDHHPIFKLFGITKRIGPAEIEFGKGKISRAVKYVGYMEKKMHDSAGSPKEAQLLLYLATHRSLCFKASALRKAESTWYKSQKLEDIEKSFQTMQTMDLDKYKYRRVDILKANGKIRPLGVPAINWRLYQTIVNGFLLHWLKPYMFPSQHGFVPGKGTGTAWQEIIQKVIPCKYIYEVDFKEFYDRINLDNLRDFLLKTGLSKELVHQIILWSRTMPQQPNNKEKILNSRFDKMIREITKNSKIYPKSKKSNKQSLNSTNCTSLVPKKAKSLTLQATDVTWMSTADQFRDLQTHLNSKSYVPGNYLPSWDSKAKKWEKNWKNNYNYFNGVAQGSALSPTLASILLTQELFLNHPGVFFLWYADDGLIYSDIKFDPEAILQSIRKECGIVAHTAAPKSKWVKYNGEWLCDLKFLGQIFVPFSNLSKHLGEFKNATRTPRDFTFNYQWELGLVVLYDDWIENREKEKNEKQPDERILEKPFAYGRKPSLKSAWQSSKYFGWVTSRIYNGSMKDIELLPEWKEYSFIEGSWSYIDALKHNQPIVLSSKSSVLQPYFTLAPTNTSPTNLFNASSLATIHLLNYLRDSGVGRSKYKNSTLISDIVLAKNTEKVKNRKEVNFFYIGQAMYN